MTMTMTHSNEVSNDLSTLLYVLDWGVMFKDLQNCRFCASHPVERQDRFHTVRRGKRGSLVLLRTGLRCSEFMNSKIPRVLRFSESQAMSS